MTNLKDYQKEFEQIVGGKKGAKWLRWIKQKSLS